VVMSGHEWLRVVTSGYEWLRVVTKIWRWRPDRQVVPVGQVVRDCSVLRVRNN